MDEVQSKLGHALKLERERRNLSLETLSQQLKITEGNLQAIEDGDIAALPGKLYFKMFARSYAEALGIDYERTIEAIREELGEPIETSGNGLARNKTDDERQNEPLDNLSNRPNYAASTAKMFRTGLRSTGVMIALGLVVIVLAVILFVPKGGKFGFLRIGDSQPTDDYAANVADSTDTDASDYRVVAGSKDKTVLTLEMVARDRTWATIIADGDTAVHYTLKPWREYVVGAQEKLVVSIVSPLSVDIKLNGIPVDFSDPEKGTVQNVDVTLENMSLFIKRPDTDSAGLDTSGAEISGSPEDSTTKPATSPAVTPAKERPAAKQADSALQTKKKPTGGR